MSRATALDRTLRLLGGDLFQELASKEILGALTSTKVLLGADRGNLDSPAAQSALVAAFCCLAELGFEVVLDIPDVSLAGNQPPLTGQRLRAALFDLGDDLITPARSEAGSPLPIAQVLIGDCPAPLGELIPTLRLGGEAFAARVELGSAHPPRFQGEVPFGAILAGAAVAAEVLRLRCAGLVAGGVSASREFDLRAPRRVAIDLPPVPIAERVALGSFDVVSAGAITNSFFFAMLRILTARGEARVFDPDRAEVSNLNRYPLLRRANLGEYKVDLLAEQATESLRVTPVPHKMDEALIAEYGLAERVIVGVDHIPSRWIAQRHCGSWVCVGATSHFTALVSEHTLQGPCAGCLHPRDDPEGPALLPTISFVSMLAGTLQAYRAYAYAVGVRPQPPTLVAGFNLPVKAAMSPIGLAPSSHCPVGCRASRRLAAA
jgi:hypothetical protein